MSSSGRNWDKIRFFIENYDVNRHRDQSGHHKNDLAKQDVAYFIEAISGYSQSLKIPLTRLGQSKFGCLVEDTITIRKLFEYWKKLPHTPPPSYAHLGIVDKISSDEIHLNFTHWLNEIVFEKYMNKSSPLAAEVKPIKFYMGPEKELLKLTIRDGVFYKDFHEGREIPFDTAGKAYLFVRDSKGDFYVTPEESGDLKTHHSSILNHEPVMAAGMMNVEDGKITVMNNLSGHYKPDLHQIYATVSNLAKKNLFSEDARIMYTQFIDEESEIRVFEIADFLKEAKSAADEMRSRKRSRR